MPVPQLKTNELVAKINALRESGNISRLNLQYLIFEARKVRELDFTYGEMLIGMIEGLDNNLRTMQNAFENALATRPTDNVVIFNYGLSLYYSGLFSESIQVLMPIADNDKNAAMVMAMACRAMGLTGKARHYFAESQGNAEGFDDFMQNTETPKSALIEPALAILEKSFKQDAAIWQSLSNR